MENKEIAIQLSGVRKMYKLGQIGGGTLSRDLQSWWARIRGKEDPNTIIGTDQRLVGQTFMALNGIDLTVYKGEALGIIGGNGAGKSTMLKLLSQVTAPTEGTILLNGRVASMLEVGTGFHGEMTGRENVYLNGAILGMSKAEIDAKMEDIIEFSEVREFIDTPVKRYSSGMYVKLAFSVAAHLDSEILIMDEVLAVGDMKFQQKCLGKMSDAASKEGRTVLYVSHNMNTIRQLCSRCIVLHQGKVIFDGDVEEAISIYMQNETQNLQSDVDLSTKKRGSIDHGKKLKMTAFRFEGKGSPRIKPGESIDFAMDLSSHGSISDACVRCMVYYTDGSPVCMASTCTGDISIDGENSTITGTIDVSCLAPGPYYLKLAAYHVNQFGTEEHFDVVDKAVYFSIDDESVTNNMAWSHQWWGHVRLPDIKLK